MYLKELASKFPGYCTLLVHGRGKGYNVIPAEVESNPDLAHKIVATIIPLDAYKAEIIVEGE